MISTSHKFLFVHVPRTAGNAAQRFLEPYSEDELWRKHRSQDGIERFAVRSAQSEDLKKHSTLSEYRDVLGHDALEDLFSFAVVRNPWDRLVSLYHRTRGDEWDASAFVDTVTRAKKTLDFISLAPSEDITAGKAPLRHDLDYVIRFERFDEGMREVCAKIGIPYTPPEVVNRVERRHYTEFYDDSLRDFVGEMCEPEIELFGYEFGA